jgi:hypothetical protein
MLEYSTCLDVVVVEDDDDDGEMDVVVEDLWGILSVRDSNIFIIQHTPSWTSMRRSYKGSEFV